MGNGMSNCIGDGDVMFGNEEMLLAVIFMLIIVIVLSQYFSCISMLV